MSKAVIDVGSNSVRLLLNGVKYMENTQLAEKLALTGSLLADAMNRTADAVKNFFDYAMTNGAAKTDVFATEAVRSASNGAEFAAILAKKGMVLRILTPSEEAKLGFLGAYTHGTQGILDVGGASSELAVGDDKGIIYSHSLPLGCVKCKDLNLTRKELAAYACDKVKEYGFVPPFDELISIGGTTSTLVSVLIGLEPYDTNVVHNYLLGYDDVDKVVTRILATPVEERVNIKGLHPKKILVTPAGGVLVMAIMEYLHVRSIRISERDNLEGYLTVYPD